MLLHRLDAEVGNLPHMADACDESGNLAERDSSLGTTVPDHCGQDQDCLRLLWRRHLGQRLAVLSRVQERGTEPQA
jgi:hypothetical protein